MIYQFKIDPNGGMLRVEFTYSNNIQADYSYYLFREDGETLVTKGNGTNQTVNDDVYSLPGTAAQNIGRYVNLVSAIFGQTVGDNYTIDAQLFQKNAQGSYIPCPLTDDQGQPVAHLNSGPVPAGKLISDEFIQITAA